VQVRHFVLRDVLCYVLSRAGRFVP